MADAAPGYGEPVSPTSPPTLEPADGPLAAGAIQSGELIALGGAPRPLTGDALTDLLDAMLSVAAELSLPEVLNQFLSVSLSLTGARYGAINVLDTQGASTTFVFAGIPTAVARMLEHGPHARGVLGAIPAEGALRLDDLRDHPAFVAFPKGHPPMGSFLGASVRVGRHVFGQLYLSEKAGGFTDADETVVTALAAAAGVAVENARLYQDAEQREHWLRASQEITTMMLEGADEEEALGRVVTVARQIAGAKLSALVMPGVGGHLYLEMVDGEGTDHLVGLMVPPEGMSWSVMRSGRGQLSESMSQTSLLEELKVFGPAMYAPLQAGGRTLGVLVVARGIGDELFDDGDLDTAESFARQAALAFLLAEARHAQDVAALTDERDRIARDLHDMAVQQLFATGMQLEALRTGVVRGESAADLDRDLRTALENVDGSIRAIRAIVHALRDADATKNLRERLTQEAERARAALGFLPRIELALDGRRVAEDGSDDDRLEDRLGARLADDVVAVIREGFANTAKHAHARHVTVTLKVDGKGPTGSVVCDVLDDGVGLPRVRHRHSGTGNLAARARLHGGTFSLGTAPTGHGTLLRWQAPLG